MPTYRNTTTGFKYNRELIEKFLNWRTYYLIRYAKTKKEKYKERVDMIDKRLEFLKPKIEEFETMIAGVQKVKVKMLIEPDEEDEVKKNDDEYNEWLKRLGC